MSVGFPFVLDGFPRTGSTTLTRILQAHPEINCCMEPFHPQRFGGNFNRQALEKDGMESALRAIRLRWNGLKHVWEPSTGWPFIGQQDLNDDLVRNSEVVVTLRRRNLLRQYVSAYVSKRLGFWVGTTAEFRARLSSFYLPPLTVAEAASSLTDMKVALDRRDQLLKSLPCKNLMLYYEDLFNENVSLDEQKQLLNRLFGQLGHRTIDNEEIWSQCKVFLDPQVYRWANNDVYACIPGAILLDQQLGNDETGRLFI
jgi:hypothetical protein